MSTVISVLIVEDSASDAGLLVRQLQRADFEVCHERVDTGERLRAALERQTWDVVLSDFSMPGFNAGEALGILQETGLDIPFIIVSGAIGEEVAVELMRAGAHDYVMKNHLTRLAPAVLRELREARIRQEGRHAAEALRASEARFRHIANNGQALIWTAGLDRSCDYFNETWLTFTGRSLEEELGDGWTAGIHPDDLPRRLEVFHHAFERQERFSLLYRLRRHDGEYRWLINEGAVRLDHLGKFIGYIGHCMDMTEQKRTVDALLASEHELHELYHSLTAVREEERRHISRELHDELGQMLTALRIDLNWLEAKLPPVEPTITAKLTTINKLLNQTVDSVRRISEDLRPDMLDNLGLAAAIENLVGKFAERTGIPCELKMNSEDFEVDDKVAIAIFRAAQESLTNALRHAAASKISLSLHAGEHDIELSVQDNGRGLPAIPDKSREKRRGFGLRGMRERVAVMNGRFSIASEPGQGVRIDIQIPRWTHTEKRRHDD